jgi:exopolysaccharide biosynthesis WecB/TagA/CpsF family protein
MVSILNIRLDLLTKSELEQKLEHCLQSNTLTQIATINPEFLLYAFKHPTYQAILNACTLNIIDGRGVQLAITHKYKVKPDRIPGVDIVQFLMKLAQQNKLKVLFLGGKAGVAQKAANEMMKKYPGLAVIGLSGGHIQKINNFWKQDKNIFECINNYKPDILIVGLGHPKQEEWIADHKKLLTSVKIAIGAGGTIDYLAGSIPRAPIFFRNLGLEWLYRLCVEPWRYKRIFQALIIFPITYFMNTTTISKFSEVRTRFAPSPTGFLHIGGLRTALYNYLYAKQHKGKFILRIEDTDQERLVPNAQQQLIQTLKSFNLEFDEGPGIEGKYGPYIQSQRLHLYQEYVQKLLDSKAAYYCFCTTERLQELREMQEQVHQPSKYDRHCLQLNIKEIEEKIKNNEPHVVRLRIPEGHTSFNDLIRGEVSVDNQVLDDQIILKSDGYPTYHLANVVDDHLMKITHVIRGEEWIPSTPKHIILYQAFGWLPPEFSHLPLLLNADKSKLSKRQGDVAAEDYLQKGYLPEALLNFIALLGWNPGTDDEIFSLSELTTKFTLEKVQKSGAVFNIQKLKC